MTKIASSLALAALQVIEGAVREGTAINPGALAAVNSGLSGLITQGLEPTPSQAEAVNSAIDNLLTFAEEKGAEEVETLTGDENLPVVQAPEAPAVQATDAPEPAA